MARLFEMKLTNAFTGFQAVGHQNLNTRAHPLVFAFF